MNQHPASERERKVLSEQLATRVLTRASELDAALKAGATVAELRRAALEAGISAEAFEAALAELQDDAARVPDANVRRVRGGRGGRGGRSWFFAVVIGLVMTVGAYGIARRRTPDVLAVPMVEEAFVLRCLAPGQAAALVRPLMRLPQNTVTISPERAPGMITGRGTPDQMQQVRLLLDRYEEPAACPAAPPRPEPAPADR